MKRIQFACLEQTIHFMLKEDVPKQIAMCAVDEEYASYKAQMERNRTQSTRSWRRNVWRTVPC